MYPDLKELVGKTVKKIYMNAANLKFETDGGNFVYGVEGDCCSRSVFYDFYGVKNLLENGNITEVKEVNLFDGMPDKDYNDERDGSKSEDIKVYGYQITTESPKFGLVTSVFSFRNYSNGYYGGSLTKHTEDIDVQPEVTEDVIEIKGE